jgi:hypothetical protein
LYKSILNSWLILYPFDLIKNEKPSKTTQHTFRVVWKSNRRNGAKIDTPDSRLHRQNCLCSTEYINKSHKRLQMTLNYSIRIMNLSKNVLIFYLYIERRPLVQRLIMKRHWIGKKNNRPKFTKIVWTKAFIQVIIYKMMWYGSQL